MVIFPPEFVKTKYPGYFWNTVDQQLYTIKVTGVLRPMKLQPSWSLYVNGRYQVIGKHYGVSVGGVKKILTLEYLKGLRQRIGTEPVDMA